MVLSIPSWAFALLPLAFFVAALFWGAPAVALVSELIGAVTGKPFPARCARQISALAVRGHALGWMCVLIAGGVLWSGSFWQSPWATGNRLMLILAMALPLCGTLALVAYDLGWKGARERRLFHILLGCVANVPIKYGYWGLAGLALLAFRDLPPGHPAFLPPASSPLWPLFGLWMPLSLCLAGGLGLGYLVLRRNKDDWGRDYYRYAAPFLGKWQIAGGLMTLAMLVWLFVSLQGVFNLFLPRIFYPGLGSAICLVLAMALSLALCCSENPMRLKGSMAGIIALCYLHCALLVAAICETLTRYVPGWSLPTFVPDLLQLVG